MIHLFAYGTLQLPEVFHAVTGRLRASEPATLTGYGRYGLLGLAYPGLIHEPGARTEGLLYRNLTGSELSRLDGFEAASDVYKRQALFHVKNLRLVHLPFVEATAAQGIALMGDGGPGAAERKDIGHVSSVSESI